MTCVFCKREMRSEERFGCGPLDWDKVAGICPECWDASTADPCESCETPCEDGFGCQEEAKWIRPSP